jgi:hypothetical protein
VSDVERGRETPSIPIHIWVWLYTANSPASETNVLHPTCLILGTYLACQPSQQSLIILAVNEIRRARHTCRHPSPLADNVCGSNSTHSPRSSDPETLPARPQPCGLPSITFPPHTLYQVKTAMMPKKITQRSSKDQVIDVGHLLDVRRPLWPLARPYLGRLRHRVDLLLGKELLACARYSIKVPRGTVNLSFWIILGDSTARKLKTLFLNSEAPSMHPYLTYLP